jgi:hypothetical protein
MVRDRAPCVESLPDKGAQAAGPVVQVANGGTSVYSWKNFRLRGSIKELKDKRIEGLTLEGEIVVVSVSE